MPQPPAVRVPRWRRWGKRVVITVGVVLAVVCMLCCAGGAYVAYDAYRTPREQKAMSAFARDVCADLVAGDAAAVYAVLSGTARGRYSDEAFARSLGALGPMTACKVLYSTYLFLLDSYVTIETATGSHTVDLVKHGDRWRVDSDILHDLKSPARHSSGGGGGGDWDD